MKTYIKPSIEEINLGAESQILQSSIEVPGGNNQGDGTQGAPGRKRVYIEDDYEEDSGW